MPRVLHIDRDTGQQRCNDAACKNFQCSLCEKDARARRAKKRSATCTASDPFSGLPQDTFLGSSLQGSVQQAAPAPAKQPTSEHSIAWEGDYYSDACDEVDDGFPHDDMFNAFQCGDSCWVRANRHHISGSESGTMQALVVGRNCSRSTGNVVTYIICFRNGEQTKEHACECWTSAQDCQLAIEDTAAHLSASSAPPLATCDAAAAANPVAAASAMPAAENRCDVCRQCMYQCVECRDLERALKKSLKQPKVAPSSADAKKQNLFRSIMMKQFNFEPIAKDGHCLYRAFIVGYQKLTKKHLTLQDVRGAVCEYLKRSKGSIPGMLYAPFTTEEDGSVVLSEPIRVLRGSKVVKVRTTLEQYAKMVAENLYGGDLETLVLAHVYKVRINVYSWHFFNGKRRFCPQVFGEGDRGFDILFEQNFASRTGRQDHYDLVIDKFPKWRKLMNAMPTWKIDIGLCFNARGRGIKALRAFKKGDVIMFYDGHRVDDKGNVGFERQDVADLYTEHGCDPRAEPFKKSHAVCLGRVHVTGLQIDGYPLTLQMFDNVLDVGRGALCNSGTPAESNMKMVWLEAPDLTVDPINHLADCEAFLVARRDIA
jgi:hypothetical protein